MRSVTENLAKGSRALVVATLVSLTGCKEISSNEPQPDAKQLGWDSVILTKEQLAAPKGWEPNVLIRRRIHHRVRGKAAFAAIASDVVGGSADQSWRTLSTRLGREDVESLVDALAASRHCQGRSEPNDAADEPYYIVFLDKTEKPIEHFRMGAFADLDGPELAAFKREHFVEPDNVWKLRWTKVDWQFDEPPMSNPKTIRVSNPAELRKIKQALRRQRLSGYDGWYHERKEKSILLIHDDQGRSFPFPLGMWQDVKGEYPENRWKPPMHDLIRNYFAKAQGNFAGGK
ncbi:MAG: hypothetical protein JNJ45_10175 [Chthonomonas sp.]|nr:hypothetical protein [Chthonomonas sp.]